jgi:acetoin utilization deacetylase AcuC-like enzyme
MRPHRVRLTHSLVKNYGLNKRLLVHRPQPRNDDELEMFHADGAARLLRRCPATGPAVCDAVNQGASGEAARAPRRLRQLPQERHAGQPGRVHDADAALQPGPGGRGGLPGL